jgi:sugar/nucleoside kinase (ribokinase family)
MAQKIVVSGTGCCLIDLLYHPVDFNSSAMQPYLSMARGDGGLMPGKLVFREEFESFARISLDAFLAAVAGDHQPAAVNIGGPSIVSLIHASQLTGRDRCEVRFYGRTGNDGPGKTLLTFLTKTPVVLEHLQQIDQPTPSTLVLSDPEFDGGHGERMFINSIGAAWSFGPDQLAEDFFNADIAVFGGTALVPGIHDHLTSLLAMARKRGCITVVNTVYDFRSEKNHPSARWPLGNSDESYRYIDLLITDREEAFGLSGETEIRNAMAFFRGKGVHSLLITDGSRPVHGFSDGTLFSFHETLHMPVSRKVTAELERHREGDTTGCGDNFAGGVIAFLAHQLSEGIHFPDLSQACAWGVVSGGFACFYLGGTYMEDRMGEKLKHIKPYLDAYQQQIAGSAAS